MAALRWRVSDPSDPRLDAIVETLTAFARHDFSPRAPVTGTDTIDAIATGLNMLAEELHSTVASRAELEEANARLVAASRMAAVGMLAAGVAHEINNPATWIALALGMLRRSQGALRKRLEGEGDIDRAAVASELATNEALLADCIEGMLRITAVVGDLRSLSRADDRTSEPIDFEELIASCCRLASHVLEGVVVTVDVQQTPAMLASRGRIAQVVTNLLVNAAQAVSLAERERREVSLCVTTHEGGTLLVVEARGPGIPSAMTTRVFEPFFTTKGSRDGTGLGLTIVAQIASTYGGWARVSAGRARTGARVEVWFPPTEAPGDPGPERRTPRPDPELH